MKTKFLNILLTMLITSSAYSQTPDDIINLLVEKQVINQDKADSVRADAAIKQQDAEAKKKSFTTTAAKSIKISGYTQARYQHLEGKYKTDGADIRRARIDIKGKISPFWNYRLQTDFAGAVAKLLDAYAEMNYNTYINIGIGQMKAPLSMENLLSSNKMEAIDRSQAVEALTARSKDILGNHNGRDIGLKFFGSAIKIKDKYFVDYSFGIFNGNGINQVDNNGEKDVAGSLVFHPIKGFDIGGSYYGGTAKYNNTINKKTVFSNHNRERMGADICYEFENATIKAEYLHGLDAGVHREGYFVQAGYYIIPQKLQILGKYDTYDTDLRIDDNISTVYTGVINYNFNPFTRIQFALNFRTEEEKEINNNTAILQFQIGF